MKHVIPISGKDSLATAIIQKRLQPELEYEYIFNPTGKELPETIEWLKRVEIYLGKEILFIGYDMKETKEWKDGFRPKRYEWIWLHDFHPDLFWTVVEDEETQDTRDKPFFTIKGLPLRKLLSNRAQILDRHITKTTNLLMKLRQTSLFTADDIFSDFLSLTSCGLLCGK
jgi:hypothetical protein